MNLEYKVLTVREVARALRVSEDTVRGEIGRGRLLARKVGRSFRIPADALERYLDLGVQPVGRSGGELAEDAEDAEGR